MSWSEAQVSDYDVVRENVHGTTLIGQRDPQCYSVPGGGLAGNSNEWLGYVDRCTQNDCAAHRKYHRPRAGRLKCFTEAAVILRLHVPSTLPSSVLTIRTLPPRPPGVSVPKPSAPGNTGSGFCGAAKLATLAEIATSRTPRTTASSCF